MSYVSLIDIDKGRARAFTLIELVVAFTLTLLLVGLLFQFLVPALTVSSRTTRRAEVQQQATITMRNLVSELEQTSLFGLSLADDFRTAALHPVTDVTQKSERVYADHVIVYQFDPVAESLQRSHWSNGSDPSIEAPRKLSPDELLALDGFLTKKRVVVRQLEDFEVGHSGSDGLIQLPLVVRMTMKRQGESSPKPFELVRTVVPRNQE